MRIYRQQEGCGKKTCLISAKLTQFMIALCFCIMLISPKMTGYAYTETPGVVIADSAKIRSKADTSGEVLGSVNANKTISICGEETGSDGMVWYQVYVNASTKGYIRSDLVKKSGSSSESSQTTTSLNNSSSQQSSSVTPMDSQEGKVITDNVNIRSAASTTADVVANAKKGLSVTVTGKANGTDGKTWYQVSFNGGKNTGFIRSDLVTFDLESDAATTEITGTVGEGGNDMEEEMLENQTESENEEEQEQEQEQENTADEAETNTNTSVATTEVILMNTEEEPYVMPSFEQVVLNWKDQQINAWKNGDFYIFYAQVNGNEGWYLYDQPEDVYQRYVYETSTAEVPKASASGSTILIAAMGIVIALLIGVIVVMFLKLRDADGERWDDDEDDEDYGDDEDDDDDEEEEIVRGRSVTHRAERVPVRGSRMNPSMDKQREQRKAPVPREDEMPRRRLEGAPQPRPTGAPRRPVDGQRPVRRPEGAPQSRPVNRPEGPQGRPVNGQGRPAPQGRRPAGTPVRRPEGAPQGRPRQAGPNDSVRTRRVQPQQKQQDDIEFIDI